MTSHLNTKTHARRWQRRAGALLACAGLLATAPGGIAATVLPKVPPADTPTQPVRLQVKPTRIVFGGDGSHYLGGTTISKPIHWTSWTAQQATGTGDYWITSLTGPDSSYPVTISLTKPETFHGQLVFGTLTYHFDQPVSDFKQTQVFTVSFMPGRGEFDGFYWG